MLVAVLLLLAACGTSTQSGLLKVYFCTTVSMPDCKANATRAEEQAVMRALRRNPEVTSVTFVSKSTAARRLGRQFRKLFKRLPANPLPDTLSVTVRSEAEAATLGPAACGAHYAGVQPCSSSGTGDSGGVQWMSNLGVPLR